MNGSVSREKKSKNLLLAFRRLIYLHVRANWLHIHFILKRMNYQFGYIYTLLPLLFLIRVLLLKLDLSIIKD